MAELRNYRMTLTGRQEGEPGDLVPVGIDLGNLSEDSTDDGTCDARYLVQTLMREDSDD